MVPLQWQWSPQVVGDPILSPNNATASISIFVHPLLLYCTACNCQTCSYFSSWWSFPMMRWDSVIAFLDPSALAAALVLPCRILQRVSIPVVVSWRRTCTCNKLHHWTLFIWVNVCQPKGCPSPSPSTSTWETPRKFQEKRCPYHFLIHQLLA